jgi:F0F1-type ATP synthase assembly protein I
VPDGNDDSKENGDAYGNGDSKDSSDSGRGSFQSMLAQAARFSELAFYIPAAIVVGYLIGLGLEHWLHRSWLLIVGVLLGVAAGFVQMIRRALQLSK